MNSLPVFLSSYACPPGEHMALLPVPCIFRIDSYQYYPGGADWLVSGDWLCQMCRTADAHIVRVRPRQLRAERL